MLLFMQKWNRNEGLKLSVCVSLYLFQLSQHYTPSADITAPSFTPSFVSPSCHHRTQEHELDEKETLSLLCELGTERNQSEH